MAQSFKHLTLGFGSGHDLMVLEIGLVADMIVWSLGFSLSLSLSLPLPHSCPLCL